MLLHLILGFVAVMAATFTFCLLMVIVGIQRGDHRKRLTGHPIGCTEAIARRMLTGSRGCDPRDDARGGQR